MNIGRKRKNRKGFWDLSGFSLWKRKMLQEHLINSEGSEERGSRRERHVVINQPAAAGNAYRW